VQLEHTSVVQWLNDLADDLGGVRPGDPVSSYITEVPERIRMVAGWIKDNRPANRDALAYAVGLLQSQARTPMPSILVIRDAIDALRAV
jgi:hypothetical protein